MRLVILSLVALVSLSILGRVAFEYGYTAMADTGPAASSGSAGSGSGSAIAVSSQLHDPATAPAQAAADASAAFHVSWPLGVLVSAYMLLELAAWFGRQKAISWLVWLGKGRASVAIAGGTAVAAAMIDKLAAGGGWGAIIGAAIAAGAVYWHPGGVDATKGQPASA